MGLVFTAIGADFEENAVSFIPPVADGLRYWGYLNDSQKKLGRNFAPDGDSVVVVGSPVVDERGAILDSLHHIETVVPQTHSFTLITIGRPVADGSEQGMFISNYSGPRQGDPTARSFGVSLYCAMDETDVGKFHIRASVARYSGVNGSPTGLNYASLLNRDINQDTFMAMSYDGDEKIVRAYDLTVGDSNERPPLADFTDVATSPFFIGATPQLTGFPSKAKHISFGAIYDRKLSKAELDLIYVRAKDYFAPRGVSI